MRALLDQVVASKPPGWSAVLGDRELVVRPEDRSLGKFSVTISSPGADPSFCLAFFSATQDRWDAREYFPLSGESAKPIVAWAVARLADSRRDG